MNCYVNMEEFCIIPSSALTIFISIIAISAPLLKLGISLTSVLHKLGKRGYSLSVETKS